jgi:hypothetical protein
VVFIAITKAEKFSKLLHSLVKRNHVPTSSSEEAFQTWRWGKWQEGHTEHPATEMSANDKSVKFQTLNPEILNGVPDRRRACDYPFLFSLVPSPREENLGIIRKLVAIMHHQIKTLQLHLFEFGFRQSLTDAVKPLRKCESSMGGGDADQSVIVAQVCSTTWAQRNDSIKILLGALSDEIPVPLWQALQKKYARPSSRLTSAVPG